MTRSGFQPGAITRFFERILAEQRSTPDRIPPYLFTHPEVEARIAAVNAQAEKLHPSSSAESSPNSDAELHEAQSRLAQLIDARRSSLPGPPAPDPALSDALLAEAERLAAAGQPDQALLQLARAEAEQPGDPRVPFRVGELLAAQGRQAEAIEAYRRTVRLDPTRALVFFRLGLAYREISERHRAVYAFEQASLRAGPGNVLQRRADWEVEKLTFTIVPESGVSEGDPLAGSAVPVPHPAVVIPASATQISWWARLGKHFVPYGDKVRVRWLAPDGHVVQDEKAKSPRRPFVASLLEFPAPGAAPVGSWTVEAHIDEDVIDSQRFEVR
jgi:tetratricopeptide (TPR) repeat protein